MPWRGPLTEGEFPTLGYEVVSWIHENAVVPDGDQAGEPLRLTNEQIRFVYKFYELDPNAEPNDHPTSAFRYRRAQLVRPQKHGKGPLSAALIVAEAAGPVLFDGWDANGNPVGRPWATPWIQVVAVSEDQTDNVFRALLPMIELSPTLRGEIPDTGKTRINVKSALGEGLIEPVTSAAVSRLGQRITFAVHDETHSWTSHNGGVKLADTQRRNLAGMGGRSLETTNAWNPTETSVAQTTYESSPDDVYIDYPTPPKGSIRNKKERRRVLKAVYGDSYWIDLDRIDAEIEELLPRDPNQAERFFLNRVLAGSDQAFDLDLWKSLAAPKTVEPGTLITLGFDGAIREDSTGLVATEVESGYQFVLASWERPRDADDWQTPLDEVNEAVEHAFETYDVARFYADPPYFETMLDEWAGRWGDKRVVAWWTNRNKAVAFALRAWVTAWEKKDGLSHDGNETLEKHIGNAVKHSTRIRDEATGGWLWTIRKDGAKSPRKIDLAMAAVLSFEARGDAIADGALNRPKYGTAAW